jgi:hypothetical protein
MALPKDLHIVVCTPCFGGLVTQGYMLSTTNLLLLGSQMGVNVSVELLGYDSLITRSRNSLVARFMDRPDATHLMFVDADITYQPAQIFRMAAFDKDIVAGMYPLKVRDWSAEAVAALCGSALRRGGARAGRRLRDRRVCRHRFYADQPRHLAADDGGVSGVAVCRGA